MGLALRRRRRRRLAMGLGFRGVATAASGRGACGALIVRGHTRVYMEDLDPKPWVVPALPYREMEWCEGVVEDAAGFRCGHSLTAITSVAVLRSCNGGGSHMHRVAGDKGIDSLQKHSVNDSRILVATMIAASADLQCLRRKIIERNQGACKNGSNCFCETLKKLEKHYDIAANIQGVGRGGYRGRGAGY